MVVFFVNGRSTVERFLRTWGTRLERSTRLVSYKEVFRHGSVPGANTYVFTGLEKLRPDRRWLAADLAHQLARAEGAPRILNHPDRLLHRYELLRALSDAGVNPYRAYRALETGVLSRFPVFLRFEHDHNGPTSPLLSGQRDLDRELLRASMRGDDLTSLLIVEFQNTSDEQGIFRKYNTYVFGDELINGNVAFGSDWVVKYSGRFTEAQLAENRLVLSSRAHHEPLRRIAALAGVGWGRFDYSLVDRRICVWELNTDPVLLLTPERYPPDVRAERALLAERLIDAIERLAGDDDREFAPVRLNRLTIPAEVSGNEPVA